MSNTQEKRVYLIDLSKTNFDFRSAERIGDDESIMLEAERLGDVFSLEYFADELNSENLSLDNAFILIK